MQNDIAVVKVDGILLQSHSETDHLPSGDLISCMLTSSKIKSPYSPPAFRRNAGLRILDRWPLIRFVISK